MSDNEPRLTEEEARAAEPARSPRVALFASTILIVGIFGVLYLFWSN